MIPRNTTIPTKKTRDVLDGGGRPDARSRCRCYQGERPMARRQPAARQVPPRRHPAGAARRAADRGHLRHRRQRHRQRVGARTRRTGKEQKITITASSGLSEAEIQKMVKDAAGARGRGQEAREAIEARNQLDSLIFQVEKILDENRDKIAEGDRHGARGGAQGRQEDAGEQPRPEGGAAVQERVRAAAEGVAQDGRGAVPHARPARPAGADDAAGGRGGRRRRRARRAARTTSSTPSTPKVPKTS